MKNIVLVRMGQSIRNDWVRKLIALFFAILVYFAGSQRIMEEAVWENIPVEVNIPNGLINTNEKPISVTVHVRGSKRDLQNRENLIGYVSVNERDFKSGEPYRLTITPEAFPQRKGIRVVKVQTRDQVHLLSLQRVKTRKLPVRVTFTGEVDPDYVYSEAVIPQTVEVTGPESSMKDISYVVTVPIPLDPSVTESFSYVAKVQTPNGLVVSAESVQVRVSVRRNITERSFSGIPLHIQYASGFPRRCDLPVSKTVDVVVRGPQELVNKLDPDRIHTFIDLSDGQNEKFSKLQIKGYVDVEDVEIKQIEPSHIEVKITK